MVVGSAAATSGWNQDDVLAGVIVWDGQLAGKRSIVCAQAVRPGRVALHGRVSACGALLGERRPTVAAVICDVRQTPCNLHCC